MKKLILLILIVVILPFSACATPGSLAPMNEPVVPIDQPRMSEDEVRAYIWEYSLHYLPYYKRADFQQNTATVAYEGNNRWRYEIYGSYEEVRSFSEVIETKGGVTETDGMTIYHIPGKMTKRWDEISTYELLLKGYFYERTMVFEILSLDKRLTSFKFEPKSF